jgi:hypothetical protein
MIERFGGRYLTKAGSHEILEPPAAAVPAVASAQHHDRSDLDGDAPSWYVTLCTFLLHVIALKSVTSH